MVNNSKCNSEWINASCWYQADRKKITAVENLLSEEPQLLTFFGKPVSTVEESYNHIGVPQAVRKQSQVASKYRISKGKDISYAIKDSTKNFVLGISPIANRKVFLSYHQPSFMYGMDTLILNRADIDSLERSYRLTLKKFMCLPRGTPSAAVYLILGVLPFEAQRNLEILELFGQISICPSDQQNVKDIILHNLTFYGNSLKGWSTLVRQTWIKYDLPDTLDYMSNPWRADRWRGHCTDIVRKHWELKLKLEAAALDSLQYLDIQSLNLNTPMVTWRKADLHSEDTKQATVSTWMQLGVYKTREKLFSMNKTKSDKCLACEDDVVESISHLILHCEYYKNIRHEYLPKLAIINPNFSSIIDDEKQILISILNPESTMLPTEVRLYIDEV